MFLFQQSKQSNRFVLISWVFLLKTLSDRHFYVINWQLKNAFSFWLGRRLLVQFLHYFLCLYPLKVLVGQKKIQLHSQASPFLLIWRRKVFINYCCLEQRVRAQALFSSRYIHLFLNIFLQDIACAITKIETAYIFLVEL